MTTECIHCGLNKVTNVASHTHLDKNLPCGNIYIFTVRAVIYGKSGDERKVQLTIEPQAGAVTNLAVKFIPGKNATDWIKRREDGLQLTWDPPSNLDPDKIEVRNLKSKRRGQAQLNYGQPHSKDLLNYCH